MAGVSVKCAYCGLHTKMEVVFNRGRGEFTIKHPPNWMWSDSKGYICVGCKDTHTGVKCGKCGKEAPVRLMKDSMDRNLIFVPVDWTLDEDTLLLECKDCHWYNEGHDEPEPYELEW